MTSTDKSVIRRLAASVADLATEVDRLSRDLTRTDRATQAVVEPRQAERLLLAAREAIEKAVSTAAVAS